MDFLKKLLGLKSHDDQWVPFGAGADNRVNARNLFQNNKNWVYTCVDRIGRSFSSVDFKLMRQDKQGNETEVDQHEVLTLLNKPNQFMTGRKLRYIVSAHLDIAGEAYLVRDDNVNRPPQWLMPINPTAIETHTIEREEGGNLTGMFDIEKYVIRDGSKKIELDPERVLYITNPHPTNPIKGLGTMEGIAEWIDVEHYITEFNRTFFTRGITAGGIIESNATSREQIELIKAGLEQNHAGVKNSHKWMVLPSGATSKQEGMSPKDMQFDEADKRYRNKIIAAFGVPESILGMTEQVGSRAKADAEELIYMKHTIEPKAQDFEEFLNEQLLPLFDQREDFFFQMENIIPEDRELSIKENEAGVAKQPYMTINEARINQGLPEIEGGDIIPRPARGGNTGGERMFTEGSATTVSLDVHGVNNTAVKTRDVKNYSPKTSWQREDNKKKEAFDNFKMNFKQSLEQRLQEQANEIMAQEVESRLEKWEDELTKKLSDVAQQWKKIALENASQFAKAVDPQDAIDRETMVQSTIDIATPVLVGLTEEEGQAVLASIGVEQTFNVGSGVKEKVRDGVEKMSASYADTTLKGLEKTISEGIEEGIGIEDMKHRIADKFEDIEDWKARQIAHNETFRAHGEAAREAYRQSGVVETVEWVTVGDGLTCQYCRPLNGRAVSVEEPFFNKGDTLIGDEGGTLKLDYNTVNAPPGHVNCRCVTRPGKISV